MKNKPKQISPTRTNSFVIKLEYMEKQRRPEFIIGRGVHINVHYKFYKPFLLFKRLNFYILK